MAIYADSNPQPLSPEDWERIKAIKWPRKWQEAIPTLLQEIRTAGFIHKYQEVKKVESEYSYSAYNLKGIINTGFRQAGLPYRFFKTAFAGDHYAIGVVEPFKKNVRKLRKATLRYRATKEVVSAARAVARKATPSNLSQLRKALKNPNLPF